MALINPAPGDSVAAADIDNIRNHLEGASGSTAPYHLRQSTGNFLITLATADGSNGFRVNDSAGTQMSYLDSDGNLTITGTFTPGVVILPNSGTPSQTTEASIAWDTDDDAITVGSGSATLRFRPQYKGSDVASGAALNVGATGSYFDVTGTTQITSISTRPAGDVIALQFDDIVTVTHNASSLVMQDSSTYNTVAGDVLTFISEGSGNWRQAGLSPRWHEIVKGSTETVTNAGTGSTLQNDDAFSFYVKPNTDYLVKMHLRIATGTAPDWKFAWTLTGMTWDGQWTGPSYQATVAVDTMYGEAIASGAAQAVTAVSALTAATVIGEFTIHSGVTGGTLNFQWAQNTADAGSTSVLKNSFMRYRELGGT